MTSDEKRKLLAQMYKLLNLLIDYGHESTALYEMYGDEASISFMNQDVPDMVDEATRLIPMLEALIKEEKLT